MGPLRVYLIWEHQLLRDTVRMILQQESFTLVGESQGLSAIAEVDQLQPDVILAEEDESLTEHLLANLLNLNSPRLVCISLADNKLRIYHREERLLTQTADLITALQT